MHLTELLNGICCKVIGNADIEISSLSCKSSDIGDKCLFICISGGQVDGHDFAQEAVQKGAVALVVQQFLPDIKNITQIVISDSRAGMALIAKRFNNNAVNQLKVISVVGTNGKTSTTYLLSAVFACAGYKTAVVGSNGVFINGAHHPSSLTTPDPIELHRFFALMVDSGVEYVFIEVSAHAIFYKKMEGIISTATIFTNFSQDHLDFFDNMEKYASVKKSYFSKLHTKVCVVNADDALGQEIIFSEKLPCVTYGIKCPADVFALDCECTEQGIKYVINLLDEVKRVEYGLFGHFNIYNTLCVSALARVFGIKSNTIFDGISSVRRIDGRNEVFSMNNGVSVIIDYAHTPDGINNILAYLKSVTKSRLIVVFGCGGDRDRFKRPLMGRAVSTYASYSIITNDNPRLEKPQQIIDEILCGMSIGNEVILDRGQAIATALCMAKKGDIVAILGKGAEAYQEINGERIHFSDIDTVKTIIDLQKS